jgi:hypothetical protein
MQPVAYPEVVGNRLEIRRSVMPWTIGPRSRPGREAIYFLTENR